MAMNEQTLIHLARLAVPDIETLKERELRLSHWRRHCSSA